MKKLLLLGAMQMHLPLIHRAHERGIYVVTCDYIPENIGHKVADEPHYDSTTDIPAVIKLAKECQVDGVMTFNSDPAALSAAAAAEVLGLPGSGKNAVEIMSDKGKFRKFLHDHDFNVPRFGSYDNYENLEKDLSNFKFPVMLKPVDSSGSKGVVCLHDVSEVKEAYDNALNYSRCKHIIVEEFISGVGPQLHGDAFVYDGEVKFICLGDHHFDASINNLVPVSTSFPSLHSHEDIAKVEQEVQKFISAVGFKQGGINIEARISANDGKAYLIEVGPRNGGNFTPIVIQNTIGFNFVDACLDATFGLPFKEQPLEYHGYNAYLVMHTDRDGILDHVDIDPALAPHILSRYDYVKEGDSVHSFRGANAAIGVLLVRYEHYDELEHVIDNMDKFVKITLK